MNRSIHYSLICLLFITLLISTTEPLAAETVNQPIIIQRFDLPSRVGGQPIYTYLHNQILYLFSLDNSMHLMMTTIDPPYASINVHSPLDLGKSSGKPVMFTDSNGSIYLFSSSSDMRSIYFSKKSSNDPIFSPSQQVVTGGTFIVNISAGISSDGTIMLLWEDNGNFLYRTSTDTGQTWSQIQPFPADTPTHIISIAADNLGGLWITYGNKTGHIKAIYWQYGHFGILQDLTSDKIPSDYFTDPIVVVTPNNIPHIAFQNVPGGALIAEQNDTHTGWIRTPVGPQNGSVLGNMSLISDIENNLHLAWPGSSSNSSVINYAYQPYGLLWSDPSAWGDNALAMNIIMTSSISDSHDVFLFYEHFTSAGLVVGYTYLQSPIQPIRGRTYFPIIVH